MATQAKEIPKTATQIQGLDEILHGGLPTGRTTLVSGGPGSGKSVFGLQFVYQGALSGKPGIYLSFEESIENIRQNALSFGWDLETLENEGALYLMEGRIDPNLIIAGDFDLAGLMAIIGGKVKAMGAERIVIDALDMLMRYFDNPKLEAKQIFILHNWLQKQGMTAVLTTKNIKTANTPYPFSALDFMADCVIYLDQRIVNQVNTKRLQVFKYRGSGYASNEFPFLITAEGMFFNPISEIEMHFNAPNKRVSSGVPQLDRIMGGGYFTGSCILVSGESGTGKTALASTFSRSVCEDGQKLLYINYEESLDGMVAGMLSLGIDLRPALQNFSLRIMSVLPEAMGIEEHLYQKTTAIKRFEPDHIIIDAISACARIAGDRGAFDFLMRIIHFAKKRGITVLLINQARKDADHFTISGIGISSIIDTIVTLHYEEVGEVTNRVLRARKSRGAHHSNKLHHYSLTGNGIQFEDKPIQ
jgi:circadian clock protein KaiC